MKRLVFLLILVFTAASIHANQKKIVDLEYNIDFTDKYHPRYYLMDDYGYYSGYYEIGYIGSRRKKNIIVNDFTTTEFHGKVNPEVLKEHYKNKRKIKGYTKVFIISLAAILPGGIIFGTGGFAGCFTVVFSMGGIGLLLALFPGLLALVGVGAIITSIILAFKFSTKKEKYEEKNRWLIDDLINQLNKTNGAEVTIFNKKLSFK